MLSPEGLAENGYYEARIISGEQCALLRLAFTTGLVVGIDTHTYKYRYCYPRHSEALHDIRTWTDINTPPPGNWIKRKGQGGDIPNPDYKEDRY